MILARFTFNEAFPMRGEDVEQHALYSYLSPEERVLATVRCTGVTDHGLILGRCASSEGIRDSPQAGLS